MTFLNSIFPPHLTILIAFTIENFPHKTILTPLLLIIINFIPFSLLFLLLLLVLVLFEVRYMLTSLPKLLAYLNENKKKTKSFVCNESKQSKE